MNPVIRNVLGVVLGLVIGNAVNMGIITISESVIPLPEGADNKTMEGLAATIHLFKPINFLMPFLAHALGTFAGALVAAGFATTRKMAFGIGVGCFFLLGGAMMVYMVPSPMWFNVVDLGLAYIPMGILAAKIVSKKQS